MQQTHRRGDTCVARNTAARNAAAPIHTHTALNAQPDRTLSPAGTRTGITNGPYGDRKNDTPARKNGDCSRQNWQGIHPKMRGNRKTFCLLTFFYPPFACFTLVV